MAERKARAGALSWHFVRGGKEQADVVDEDPLVRLERNRGRFVNTLQPESRLRIGRVVELSRALSRPKTTEEIVVAAFATSDRKGVLGALRMLDVEGVIHASAGARRQLMWNGGPRAAGVVPPKGAGAASYSLLRDVLAQPRTPVCSTDFLLRRAGFDPELVGGKEVGVRSRRERGLPVNFFHDGGKSARKYVLGALKALYWLELVAWRNYTRQAIEWRWIGDPRAGIPDVLLDQSDRSRREARNERAEHLWFAYQSSFQNWVDERFPSKAAAFLYRQELRQKELKKKHGG